MGPACCLHLSPSCSAAATTVSVLWLCLLLPSLLFKTHWPFAEVVVTRLCKLTSEEQRFYEEGRLEDSQHAQSLAGGSGSQRARAARRLEPEGPRLGFSAVVVRARGAARSPPEKSLDLPSDLPPAPDKEISTAETLGSVTRRVRRGWKVFGK